jgi:hypothetical protein
VSPQRHQQLAVRREFANGVPEVVRAKHRAVRRDRDSVRPIELPFAPGTQEPPVAIEDRDGMLAAAHHEHPVARIRGDAHDFDDVPVVRPARPIDGDAITKLTRADNERVIHG